jgi:GNAT superfamily N-acetyltransferase
MDYSLKLVDYAELAETILEAEETQAFLQTRADPDFSVSAFCRDGHDDPELTGFRLFTIMDEKDTPTGFIAVWDTPRKGMLYIGPMYINKASRGKGLGRLQVKKLITWCRENGFRGLYTNTWGQNAAPRKIFEGLGFHLVRESENTRINADSTVYYLLDVDESK